MSLFDIGFTGLDGALKNLDDLTKRADASGGKVMLALAQRVAQQAVLELNAHTRSSPGQPPATRTGNLADSIVARAVGLTGSEVEVDADYAKHLEFGTRKMLAHAFLDVAIAIVAPEFGAAEKIAFDLVGDMGKDSAATAIANLSYLVPGGS